MGGRANVKASVAMKQVEVVKVQGTETPEALALRIERSRTIRERIEVVVQEILAEEGWPQSVRRKAEDMFAAEAVRTCEKHSRELQKIWSGTTFAERKRGAVSSLQVLLGNHAPFRTPKGRLQDAKGNADWVLDIWDLTLDEWEGPRQMRLV